MTLKEPFRTRGQHLELELPGVRVLFTTRRGGCSSGPYQSLNLGRFTEDDPEAVDRNRESLQEQLGVRFAYGRQVHGTRVRRVSAPSQEEPTLAEADGHATALPGLAPMVLTADCLPIAIAGDGSVAMLHAGWRGLAAGVVWEGASAVRELGSRGPLLAAIGPGAGPCCYEVGEEVRAAFASHGSQVRRGSNLDLKAIARLELERAGVTRVHDVELCTICSDPSLFYSHRRDHGITGRQAGIAWLT
jgi:polyphenol oxidase